MGGGQYEIVHFFHQTPSQHMTVSEFRVDPHRNLGHIKPKNCKSLTNSVILMIDDNPENISGQKNLDDFRWSVFFPTPVSSSNNFNH